MEFWQASFDSPGRDLQCLTLIQLHAVSRQVTHMYTVWACCLDVLRIPPELPWCHSAAVELREAVPVGLPGRRAGLAAAAFHKASTAWLCMHPAAGLGAVHTQGLLQSLQGMSLCVWALIWAEGSVCVHLPEITNL